MWPNMNIWEHDWCLILLPGHKWSSPIFLVLWVRCIRTSLPQEVGMACTESLGKKWELSCVITHIYIWIHTFICINIYICISQESCQYGDPKGYHGEKRVEIGGFQSNKDLHDLIRLESYTILTWARKMDGWPYNDSNFGDGDVWFAYQIRPVYRTKTMDFPIPNYATSRVKCK